MTKTKILTETEIQEFIDFIDKYKKLEDKDKKIIEGILKGKIYAEILFENNWREADTTLRDRASKLFVELTELFKNPDKINKDNFLVQIQGVYKRYKSMVYVKRGSIEDDACSANIQSGSLVRIKAPQKMGKTLLLKHILENAIREEFKTVTCDFCLFETSIYTNYAQFLKEFCFKVTRELRLDQDNTKELTNIVINRVDSNLTVMSFFEDFIFPKLSGTGNLVLALENFNNILESDKIRENFCRLLRCFYDDAKHGAMSPWNKLHSIVIHSTDIYGIDSIDSSPLAGVGEYFQLEMFDRNQIEELFSQHELDLDDSVKKQIIELLDGHPYLLTLVIKKIKKQIIAIKAIKDPGIKKSSIEFAVENILRDAPTENGIFSDRLRQLLDILNQSTDLREAYKKIVSSNNKVLLLDPKPLSFKLYSMGLIKRDGDNVSPSCDLYRKYFKKHLN